jgi:hypothetical protein
MQRAETDAAENEAARQCGRQLDLHGHINLLESINADDCRPLDSKVHYGGFWPILLKKSAVATDEVR